MYRTVFIASLTMAVACLVLVAAAPVTMDLKDVLDRTVCRVNVAIDYDPQRVPSRIKVLKCAEQPQAWCARSPHAQRECCGGPHSGQHKMACIELRDQVVVYNKTSRTTQTLEVAVGCSCIVEKKTQARPMETSPP